MLAATASTLSVDTVIALRTANFLTGGVLHVMSLGVFVWLTRTAFPGRGIRVFGAVAAVPALLSVVSLMLVLRQRPHPARPAAVHGMDGGGRRRARAAGPCGDRRAVSFHAWRPAVVVAAVLAAALTACAAAPDVPAWIADRAAPLAGADPAAPLDDLEPLRRSVGDAQVVGLGESVHGAAELTTLKHRTLRLLVERMGFRTVAWEEDWTTGLLIDAYIRTGAGDLAELMRRMSPQYRSGEVADVLAWLRAFNAGRTDPVRFVGVEYYFTGPEASDAVDAHVAATAPDRLADLRRDLDLVRPATPTMFEHIGWFTGVADKARYVDAARRVHDLVAGLAHPPGDRGHAVALHHARQIRSFYEHFAMSDAEALVHRDARAAENVRWWQELTGDRIAYWAAVAHTADASGLRIAVPPDPDMAFPSTGSYLRDRYGPRYLSVAFTFGHGTVGLGTEQTAAFPPPTSDRFERSLGESGIGRFVLDLRGTAPPPVQTWLDAPIRAHGLADRGPDSALIGGTAAEWFDVIVHERLLTPARPA